MLTTLFTAFLNTRFRRRKSVLYQRLPVLSNSLPVVCALFLRRSDVSLTQPGGSTVAQICVKSLMTHCVTNPHLTPFGFTRQICSTLFFLMFCVFHTACNNTVPPFAATSCVRHKSADYHSSVRRSNPGTLCFIYLLPTSRFYDLTREEPAKQEPRSRRLPTCATCVWAIHRELSC